MAWCCARTPCHCCALVPHAGMADPTGHAGGRDVEQGVDGRSGNEGKKKKKRREKKIRKASRLGC